MLRLNPYTLLLRVAKPIALLFVKKLYSRVVIQGNYLEVRSGIIVRRRIYIRRDAVKCVTFECGPMLRLFHRVALFATFKGESGGVDSRILLLPIVSEQEAKNMANQWFCGFLSQKGVLCLKGRHFFRERTVYCRCEYIGSIKLTVRSGKRCSLKVILHSKRKNTVKVCGLPIECGEKIYKTLTMYE